MAPWPSGKAKVCNTSTPGSNPGGASSPDRKIRTFSFHEKGRAGKSFCVRKRTEKGIDEFQKDGILIDRGLDQ